MKASFRGPNYFRTNMEILEGIRITQGELLTHLIMGFYASFMVGYYLPGNFITILSIFTHFGNVFTKFFMF